MSTRLCVDVHILAQNIETKHSPVNPSLVSLHLPSERTAPRTPHTRSQTNVAGIFLSFLRLSLCQPMHCWVVLREYCFNDWREVTTQGRPGCYSRRSKGWRRRQDWRESTGRKYFGRHRRQKFGLQAVDDESTEVDDASQRLAGVRGSEITLRLRCTGVFGFQINHRFFFFRLCDTRSLLLESNSAQSRRIMLSQ